MLGLCRTPGPTGAKGSLPDELQALQGSQIPGSHCPMIPRLCRALKYQEVAAQ